MVKGICKFLQIFVFVFLLGISVFAVSNEIIPEATEKKLIKIMRKEEGEYIGNIATNGKDIVMLSAISEGYMLVYNDLGEFQYTLQIPGGGTIHHISFLDDSTVKIIYANINTTYIFNLNDLLLQLVNSGESEDVPFSEDKVKVANGNIFKLSWVFPLQSEVKMYYDQGKSKTIYKQNLKNTIIVITIISLMLATLLYKKHKKQKNSK